MPLFSTVEVKQEKKIDSSSYVLIKSLDQLKDYVTQAGQYVGFDLEATGLNVRKDKIVGLSLSFQKNHACYVPIRHAMSENLDELAVFSVIEPALKNSVLIIHNAKYDCALVHQSVGWDIWSTNKVQDTMVLAYMSGKFAKLQGFVKSGLKEVVYNLFGYEMVDIAELFGMEKGQKGDFIHMDKLTAEECWIYGCDDSMWTREVFLKLGPQIANSRSKLMYQIEMKLVPIVQQMERTGMRVVVDKLAFAEKETLKQIDVLQQLIYSMVGKIVGEKVRFNIASPADVGAILFDEKFMGLPVIELTKKTQKPSTNAKVLDKLAKKYPVVQNIITYRRLVKHVSGFLSTLPNFVEEDGRVHCDVLQCHAATGRFAVKSPPLHGTPKEGKNPFEFADENNNRTEIDTKVRQAFIPSDGYYFLEIDLDQIEFRIAMGEAREYEIIRRINSGQDYHRIIASMAYGVPYDEVTSEQRTRAKTVNFGTLYGEGPDTLAAQMSYTLQQARDFMAKYWEMLPGVTVLKQRVIADCRRLGYVETRFGRRRYVEEFESYDRQMQSFAERTTFSTVIQGTAADIHKIGIVRMGEYLSDKLRLLFVHHDALLFEIHKDILSSKVIPIIRKAVELEIEGYPVITLTAQVGDSWGTLKKIPKEETEDAFTRSEIVPDVEKPQGKGEEGGDCEKPPETILEGSEEGKEVMMVLDIDTIDTGAFNKFVALLDANPGNNVFSIKADEEYCMAAHKTSLGIEDEALVSSILPCKLFERPNAVSVEDLAEGLAEDLIG